MSQFLNSVVRGAGFTIGRQLVTGGSYTRKSPRSSSTSSYNSYLNNEINRKLNKSFLEDNKERFNQAVLHTSEILKGKWTNESSWYQWIIILVGTFVIAPTVSGLIAYINNMLVESNIITDGVAITITLLGFILGLYLTPRFIGFKIKKKKRAEKYYNQRRKELKEELDMMNGAVKYLNGKYGEEMTLNMINRSPVKGLPLENFTFFFGEPNSIEETEDSLTLIYGTSKRAGDWFRFKDNKLVTYSVK